LASHIIAVSKQTKRDIVNLFGIAPERISVIYHGIDQIPYVPIPEANKYGRYILYVGGRNKYKNFSRFVRDITPVLNNHPDLLVVCTGKPFNHEELRMLQDIGFLNRYIQTFVESNLDLLNLYHHAQAFVYPSEYEGFGIPILEAYKAGCPVVLNQASCFPEIAGDAAIYFSFDGNGQSLQDSIEDLLVWTPVQRKQFIISQRQRLQLYSWEKAARELADIYRKVASGETTGNENKLL
jgi:glycosyltransferase involved in cell wall biosynthesis